MKQIGLLKLGAVTLAVFLSTSGVCLAGNTADGQIKAESKTGPGKMAGVVLDATGTPQMGASVELLAEVSGATVARALLTNTQGVFKGDRLDRKSVV